MTTSRPEVSQFQTLIAKLAALSDKPNFPRTNSLTISLSNRADKAEKFHFGSQQKVSSHSRFNIQSAFVTTRLVYTLVRSGLSPANIMVQAFYLDQVNLLKAIFADHKMFNGLKIVTVDGSQGDEALFGIIDSVVLGGGANETMGFLAGEKRRFNVAMTRQMAGRIVVGHSNFCEGKHLANDHPWKLFYKNAATTTLPDTWFYTPGSVGTGPDTVALWDQFKDVQRQYTAAATAKEPLGHANVSQTGAPVDTFRPGLRHKKSIWDAFTAETHASLAEAQRFTNMAQGNLQEAFTAFYADEAAVGRVESRVIEEILDEDELDERIAEM